MAQISQMFRIFVSSTLDDMSAERNALDREVWPRLRELCQNHGVRFQAIDLRWGISKEAQRDQQVVNICLGEMRRCKQVTKRPNMLILMGKRYGWRPLPYEIEQTYFEAIYPSSVTDKV